MKKVDVAFDWIPGMALSQARRRIESLHSAVGRVLGKNSVLEVSSKSPDPVGVSLSAFNLRLRAESGDIMSVEAAYQGSKVFASGGPFRDIYRMPSIDAKRDERLRTSGPIIGFDYFGQRWGAFPKSAFYDWLYVSALSQDERLSTSLDRFECFTDIAFNPGRSFNCQARAVALLVSLKWRGLLESALASQTAFLGVLGRVPTLDDDQPDLIG
ncbi:MAG: hypothetical protein U0625_12610 [Phycisphaerales bacterium]